MLSVRDTEGCQYVTFYTSLVDNMVNDIVDAVSDMVGVYELYLSIFNTKLCLNKLFIKNNVSA
jgi:hypothetical protein